MASPYSTQPNLPAVIAPYGDGPPMPASATGTLMVLASGFGIGALVVLFGFLFLVGIGDIGHPTTTGPTAAAQSAATAPVSPGPAPNPAPNTAGHAVPETTGQAPANPGTPKAPAAQQ
jgi:hypothetical protein